MTIVLGSIPCAIFVSNKLREAATKLPAIENLMTSFQVGPSEIWSADGQLLYRVMAENRKPVSFDEIPKIVVDATIAAEDRRFYQHSGIDPMAVARQVFTNVSEKRIAGGASTLTMQLAKRLTSEGEKTLDRKFGDMALAIQIERRYDKKTILELYLNQVFYGANAYGIKAAAQTYFGKDLKSLTVAEAALLARLVRRPSSENPFANLKRAIDNRNVVLGVMREEGMITPSEYEAAVAEKVKLVTKRRGGLVSVRRHPYAIDYILDDIRDHYPEIDLSRGGYKVEVTLNSQMQEISEQAVRDLVRRYRGSRVRTGAFILTDKGGRVKAIVGGVDYDRNQFNVASQGRRQPGSSFKPFIYAKAFQDGVYESIYDTVSNERFAWKLGSDTWSPQNSNGKYGGAVTVRTAFAWSMNVPAARTLQKIGVTNFTNYAQNAFGFTTRLSPVRSISLGSSPVSPLEMARAYSVFMLRGKRFEPYVVARITATDGTTLVNNQPQISISSCSPDAAEKVAELMSAVVNDGTGKAAQAVLNAHGKTGTTSDNKDAWFCGFTNELLGISWIANEQLVGSGKHKHWRYQEMESQVFGGTVTVQMWVEAMRQCQKIMGERPREDEESRTESRHRPEKSDSIVPEDAGGGDVKVAPDVQAGDPPSDGPPPAEEPAPSDDGPPVEEPKAEPARHREDPKPPVNERTDRLIQVMICADTGELAREACPEQVPRMFRRGTQPRSFCHKHR